ncbi:MAG TPA: VOC family protein [Trebonia sp.]|jgi:predicted 3-demethylubiquinone-9 3-methyltransferase (glyoxalase superfamily)|nr:VOC family protein [Trebonia sp.]
MTGKPFTTCLWFDTEGEEAAEFYTSIFKDSSIGAVSRYGEAGPRPAGTVMTVEFTLNGQKFVALNGGQEGFSFDESVSLMIEAADQAEVDYYWERLTDGGQESACGWLKDKFGFSWQVVPSAFYAMMRDPDPEKVNRVTAAMLTMKKLSVPDLERAYAGA